MYSNFILIYAIYDPSLRISIDIYRQPHTWYVVGTENGRLSTRL